MNNIRLEIADNEEQHTCECCGRASNTAHGFVYRNDIPWSVYYAGWSEGHPERGVTLAIAIGEWGEGSTIDQRTCFGIEAFEGQEEVFFKFIDPELSAWPNTKLLGPQLRRDEALLHPLRGEALTIAEKIVRGHASIRQFLSA